LSPFSLSIEQDTVQQVEFLRLIIIVFYKEVARFYDLKSGTFLGEAPVPLAIPEKGKPWARVSDAPLGIYGQGGIWQLIPPALVEITRVIAKAKSENNITNAPATTLGELEGCYNAAKLCKDSALKPWHAKYLLDVVIGYVNRCSVDTEGSDENTFDDTVVIEACKGLLPHMQNPGLVLALLAKAQSSPGYVTSELKNFIQKWEQFVLFLLEF